MVLYRFNKEQQKEYQQLVRRFYNEGLFLKDARDKARFTLEGRLLSKELEVKNKSKER